jgi:hypothetical protein
MVCHGYQTIRRREFRLDSVQTSLGGFAPLVFSESWKGRRGTPEIGQCRRVAV